MLELHQSELATFRRCRRRWALSSPNMANLEPVGQSPEALWFGSGVHFALEDFHGYNIYGGLSRALRAFDVATRDRRPENAADLIALGSGMLAHYERWGEHRNDFDTLWVDGVPQVEVNWRVPVRGIDPELAQLGGTFDRLVVDPHGRVWVLDWKTCGQFNTSKLDLDAQTSVYLWAYRELFGVPAEGMVYVQLKKAVPEPPRCLKNGALSVDKSQNTTWDLYREAMLEVYGERAFDAKTAQLEFLAWLRDQEDDSGDRFIRRDLVRRNEAQLEATADYLAAQVRELLPLADGVWPDDLRWEGLYPNPTHDCGMCPFHSLCLSMDDGSDWRSMIDSGLYAQRERTNTPWRKHLPDPRDLPELPPAPALPPPAPRPPAAVSLELPPQWWE
jgi:RecB family exonuclease